MAGFKLFAYVAPVLLFCASASAGAAELSCEQDPPLLVLEWDSIGLGESEAPAVGEWRLPLSPSRPDVITEARVELRFVQEHLSEDWKARLHFSFPDPKPFGIPFTFQRAELSWATSEGTITHRLDWSNSCSNPGRGLYPGQQWKSDLELSGTRSSTQIVHPILRIWGSRN